MMRAVESHERAYLVPSSVQVMNWADFGSFIILQWKSRTRSRSIAENLRYALIELRHKVVGPDRLSQHVYRRPRVRARQSTSTKVALQRLQLIILLPSAIAPINGAPLCIHTTIAHFDFVVWRCVHGAVGVIVGARDGCRGRLFGGGRQRRA